MPVSRFAERTALAGFHGRAVHVHRTVPGLTRRQFIHVVGAAGAALSVARVLRPSRALAAPGPSKPHHPHGHKKHKVSDPKPIGDFLPGEVFDASNHHHYHVLGFGDDGTGQFGDPSSIGDFHGKVAALLIDGEGTGTPTAANPAGQFHYELDMRLMEGEYIGVDGKHHHGAFGFL